MFVIASVASNKVVLGVLPSEKCVFFSCRNQYVLCTVQQSTTKQSKTIASHTTYLLSTWTQRNSRPSQRPAQQPDIAIMSFTATAPSNNFSTRDNADIASKRNHHTKELKIQRHITLCLPISNTAGYHTT